MRHHFDVVVLGGGSGGYATALRAAQLGRSVCLIERDMLGGTCLHRGCVPTKALLHTAELADAARAGSDHGIRSTFAGVDVAGVRAYQDRVVDRLYTGLGGLVQGAGITVVAGAGHLTGSTTVQVDGIDYTGRDLVLATGSFPRTLPGIPLGPRVITSDEALQLDELPSRVAVIGGSVIGVEFASIWCSYGVEVTVIEALSTLVPQEDHAVSKQLERAFRARGINLRTGARVVGVEETDGSVSVVLETGEALEVELVLVAVGREPRSADQGFAENGIALDRGWVVTDQRLRTSVPHVYAVGDLVAGLQLAHRGFAHGIFAAEEIAGLAPEPVEDRVMPRVTYCDPEIASVGLTEAQARDRYDAVQTSSYNLAGNSRSQILGTTGFVKVVSEQDGPIVGVHMVGARMGEQIGEATLVVAWEALPEDVARFIHAHPTQNEALGEAAMALAGRPLHGHS